MIHRLLAAFCCLFAAAAMALNLGDKAPALDGAEWVKGRPSGFGEKIVVVEFWATWCPPCRTSIPHLTELQKEHGDDIEIIGLSNEDLDTVKPFVAEQEDMDYVVGVAPQELYDAYMDGIPGIPHAFLVDKAGKVIWHGHPMQLDKPLADALTGTFDAEATGRMEALNNALQAALETNDMQQIAEACDAIIEASPADERALYIRRLVAQRTDDAQGFANVVEKIDVGKLNAEEAATLAMLLLDDTDFRYRHVKVAAGCARRALEQAPESSLSRQAYAEVLYAAGKLEAAVKWLEKAAQDPEADPIVKLKLAHLKAIVELAKGLE